MPRVASCDIGIEVDGRRLEEYDTKIEGKFVTTWIASEAGKHFAIDLKTEGIDSDLSLEISLDGNYVAGYRYKRESKGFQYSSAPITDVSHKPFLFSKMTLTDDENLASPFANVKEMGSVRVVLKRGAFVPGMGRHHFANLTDSLIHERAKKVGSHRILLGEERKCAPITWMTFIPSPMYPHPIAEFTFLYRPRPFLQAQGIIPQVGAPPFPVLALPQAAPSREASEGVQLVKEASEVELAEERQREEAVRVLREERLAIDRRLADLEANARPLKRIKTEVKPDPEWATYTIVDGVIDLTAD